MTTPQRSSGATPSSSGCARSCAGPGRRRRVPGGRGRSGQDRAARRRRGGGGRRGRARAQGAADRGRGRQLLRRARRPAPAGARRAAAAAARRSGARWRRRCCSRTPPSRSTRGWSASRASSLLDGLPGAVLLAIDDWQWLDAASAAVLTLRAAAARARRREGDRDRPQRRGRRGPRRARARAPAGQALELALTPARRRARSAGSCTPGPASGCPRPRSRGCMTRAAGNPLMALELVRAPGAEAATDIRRLLARASRGALARRARGAPVRRGARRADARGGRAARRAPAGGLEEALAAEVIVRDGGRLRFSHPLIAAVVRGAHAAGGVARDPRPARRADRRAGAARAPPRGGLGRPRRGRRGGAGGGGGPGGGARRDDRGRRAGGARRRADAGRRRAAPPAAAARGGGRDDDAWATGSAPARLLEEVLAHAGAGPLRARTRSTSSPTWSPTTARCELAEAALGRGRRRRRAARRHRALGVAVRRDGRRHADGAAPCRGRRPACRGGRAARSCSPRRSATSRSSATAPARASSASCSCGPTRSSARRRAGRATTRALEILGLQLYVDGDLAEARELLIAELERGRARGYLDHESFALMLLAELEVRAGRWQLAEGYARPDARAHARHGAVERRGGRPLDLRGRRRAPRTRGVRARARRDGPPAGERARRPRLRDPVLARARVPRALARRRGDRRPPPRAAAGERGAAGHARAGDVLHRRPTSPRRSCSPATSTPRGRSRQELEARGRELDRAWAIATALRCRGLIAAADGRLGRRARGPATRRSRCTCACRSRSTARARC